MAELVAVLPAFWLRFAEQRLGSLHPVSSQSLGVLA